MTEQTLLTQSQFAAHIGKDKGYVTRLKQAGRLVMEGEGRGALVKVEESLALIEATSNPSYAAAGQNAQRGESGGGAGHHQGNAAKSGAGGAQNGSKANFNDARARNEMAKAEMAEMERDRLRGSLVDADEVRLYAADLGATFRAQLEILPDRLASELVPLNDVDAIRAALVEAFEQVLRDLSTKIEKGVV